MSIRTRLGFLRHAALSAFAALALLAGDAGAGVPDRLTQQGRLLDAQGVPETGTVTLQFTIYDAPSAGNVLWQETQTVTLDDGYFSAPLGATVPLPDTIWDGTALYLGMKVGADDELQPRTAIASVPYAILAGDVRGDRKSTCLNSSH